MQARRAVAVALLIAALGATAPNCRSRTGNHIALYGSTGDPDVLIWDSRFRLQRYEAGTFDQMRALLPHARLAPPGTRAVIESCVLDFVQPKFASAPDDAVGIVVVSGPLRGARGWVLGADIRRITSPNESRPPEFL